MGWLIGDVPLDPCEQGGADAERSVTFLPGEEVVGFSYPSAGVRLEDSHRIRQRHIRRKNHEYMDVVLRATHGKHPHAVIARNARKVVPQPRLIVGANKLHAMFRAEDNVEDGADVAMGHLCHP